MTVLCSHFLCILVEPGAMPVFRNLKSRRSSRLFQQEPIKYDEDGWEISGTLPATQQTSFEYRPDASSSAVSQATSAAPDFDTNPSFSRKKSGYSRRHEHGYVPRPKNAFIFFRSEFYAHQKLASSDLDQNDISRRAGASWKSLTKEEQRPYQILAENEKKEHQAKFPNYTYAPGGRKEKPYTKGKVPAARNISAKVISLSMGKLHKNDLNITDLVCDSPSSFRYHSPVTTGLSPHTGIELVCPPKLQSIPDLWDIREIPPLELSSTKKAKETKNKLDLSIRPPSYHHIEHQFGSKTNIVLVTMNPSLPSSDGVVVEDICSSISDSIHADWSFEVQTMASYYDHECVTFDEGPVFGYEGEYDLTSFVSRFSKSIESDVSATNHEVGERDESFVYL